MRKSIMLLAAIAILGTPSWADGPGHSGVQFRLGGFFPEGGGDLWDDNEEVFTLDISDFNDLIVGFTYLHSINNRLELGFNADFYGGEVGSVYRGWVDEDGFPIVHDTELRLVPLTVDFRWLPAGRYRLRPGGRHVRQPAFYIGAGVGMVYWEYEEVGDFLDFGIDPPEVFFDRFKETGSAFEVHGVAGVEFPIGPASTFLLEARYSAADDTLGGDFAGFGDIELSGFAVYGGFGVRF